jgi:hypothetical protein
VAIIPNFREFEARQFVLLDERFEFPVRSVASSLKAVHTAARVLGDFEDALFFESFAPEGRLNKGSIFVSRAEGVPDGLGRVNDVHAVRDVIDEILTGIIFDRHRQKLASVNQRFADQISRLRATYKDFSGESIEVRPWAAWRSDV